MKNMTLSKKLLVIAITLSLLTSVGMAFAYFSDYTEAKGEATLALKGKTDIDEQVTENKKEISIYNTGDIDMVVRVQVFGPEGMTITGAGWTPVGDWYYYNEALAPGEDSKTSTLTAEVNNVPVDPENNLEIIVVHESAPAVYDKVTGELIPQNKWFD
jgi:hypothetical protein